MVTKDGLVKILDFGLAKLTHIESGEGESHLPTMTGTSPGMVVGTAGYMSPEQASGDAVNFRSDQFSFGSILYEMATGRRAFFKKTGAETLSAIITEEPPAIATINPQVPAPLRWIAERCLAKEPRLRYASTEDLARELGNLRDHASEASAAGELAPSRRRLRWRGILGAAVFAALAAMATLQWDRTHATVPSPPTFRQLTFRRGAVALARFTPDRQSIVYGAQWESEGEAYQIYTSRLDGPESRSLGLSGTNVLAVSSTGELAFLSGKLQFLGTLERVSLAGGAPRQLLENVHRADWAPDGQSLAVLVGQSTNVWNNRLEYPIGKPLLQSKELWWIRVSPTGDTVAVRDADVFTLVDRKGNVTRFPDAPSGPFAWRHPNELWFGADLGSESRIVAMMLSGGQRILASMPGRYVLQDVDSEGRILLERDLETYETVASAGANPRERRLSWLDGTHAADITADGMTLLFNETGDGGGAERVYMRKTDGSPVVRLGPGAAAAFSPDGKWVLSGLSESEVMLLPTGPGEPRRISVEGIALVKAVDLFPDGRRVLFLGHDKGP